MDKESSLPVAANSTTATLTLAFCCDHPACAMVSSLTDVQRCQGTCWGCGRRFRNWEEQQLLHASLDAVVQHALQEARAVADRPEGSAAAGGADVLRG